MAIGDFWDVPAEPSNSSRPIPEIRLPETRLPDPRLIDELAASEEPLPPEGRVRLAIAKVLPAAEAKHRGAGRRGSAAKAVATALDDLDDADEALRRRNNILVAAIKRTQDLYIVTDQRQILRLAATDLFVENAQLALAQRARVMWRAGIVATVSAVTLLIGLSAFLVWRTEAITSASIGGNLLALGLVELLGATAIVFLTVRYLIKLSRSFFHENVSLVAKQHGLGFGRLYVYTNPDAVRLKDLQDAFGLDLESTPIFLDVKTKETADTIYSRLTQDLGANTTK